MSSSDMKFHKVLDERLNLGDQLDFSIFKGGANITPSQRVADSKSVNSLQFNVDIPSLDTCIDRKIMIKTSWTVDLTTTANVAYGTDFCLRAFPFSSLVSTLNLQTNSATTSINYQDWLPVLHRMFENEDLGYYQSGAPVYPDYFSKYSQVAGEKDPFKGFDNGEDNHLQKRGAYWVDNITRNNVNSYTIKFTSYEPIFISPLVYKACQNNFVSLFGINTMNLTFSLLSSNLGRCLSVKDKTLITAVNVRTCDVAELYMNFITPPADLILPSQSIVPFYQLQSYQAGDAVLALDNAVAPTSGQVIGKTLTLNQIPDYLFLWVRDKNPDFAVSNRFAPITRVKINFNNNDGILSNAQTLDLYRYSVDCGLNQTWQEFNGKAYGGTSNANAPVLTAYNTCGGPVVLQFGKHIQIPQGFLAPGSIGQYNIGISIEYLHPEINYTFLNQVGSANTAFNGEFMVGVSNIGLMVSSKGSSSYFSGLVDKVAVLQANDLPNSHDMHRMLGAGNFMDNLKTVIQKASKEVAKMPEVKAMAQQDNNAMGQGRTASGRSAGAMKYRLK